MPGPLSKTEVDRFYDEGFLVIPGVFTEREMTQIRLAFERLEHTAKQLEETSMHKGSYFVVDKVQEASSDAKHRIHRVVWCGAAESLLSSMGMHPKILRIAAQILGTSHMQQLINQAHFKLPGDGVEFPWHQDSLHRRYGTKLWRDVNGQGSFVEICTAVDAMNPQNGGIHVIPGSCHKGHLRVDPTTRLLPEGSFNPSDALSIIMPPGGLFLIHPYTIHGSFPNTSDQPRRLFLNGFAFPGANARIYPGKGSGRWLHARANPIREREDKVFLVDDRTPVPSVGLTEPEK